MSVSALVCLAPGSEETEAVTTIDLLVRAGVKVTTASVAGDGELTIVCSRGVKLLADAPLVAIVDEPFDAIVLPGGLQGRNASATVRCWWKKCGRCICRATSSPPSARPRRWCCSTTICSRSAT